jgi:hypothetical protein
MFEIYSSNSRGLPMEGRLVAFSYSSGRVDSGWDNAKLSCLILGFR